MISLDVLATVLSVISTVSWIMAQVPQQYENYRNKSTDGISVQFLVLWFFGDLTSFVGCYLTNQLPFQLYLSSYFLFNDLVLLYQFLHYGGRLRAHSMAAMLLVLWSRFVPVRAADTASATEHSSIGTAVAWGCTFIYLSSRVPQLIKNYHRKSVQGISPLLFAFALMGNLTYSLSIVCNAGALAAGEREPFLRTELPYILGSSGTVLFDILYFYQRWLYVRPHTYLVLVEE
ncbi:hypothetical protein KL921_002171 [Ogataea angusta]|uniref:Uncharacterized protein n=1 Tax=Pichia angusta TaxID=870730 RepID=A0ABQ7RZL2_PICAN|nr:hypothetical protein KL921_002171 [Ogataea angusta]KAG7824460.1 hypothetical protein KL909_002458 [Ogataea angusta]KAG7834968.1 hypothetical protein KL943_002283 [Ogataea angusta]KAG7840608.1 hypothetical protein KL942_002559 [Ogataea angusta]KAG7848987.1 hypothetical protein KL941_001805 [Ogataea angusta]